MTPAEAQALQDEANARGDWIVWFVRGSPGRIVATAIRSDRSGGSILGQLAASTLDELRVMLPDGLTRRERTTVMGLDVVETWD